MDTTNNTTQMNTDLPNDFSSVTSTFDPVASSLTTDQTQSPTTESNNDMSQPPVSNTDTTPKYEFPKYDELLNDHLLSNQEPSSAPLNSTNTSDVVSGSTGNVNTSNTSTTNSSMNSISSTNDTDYEISEYEKMIQRIEADTDLSPEEKQAVLNNISFRMYNFALSLVALLHEKYNASPDEIDTLADNTLGSSNPLIMETLVKEDVVGIKKNLFYI